MEKTIVGKMICVLGYLLLVLDLRFFWVLGPVVVTCRMTVVHNLWDFLKNTSEDHTKQNPKVETLFSHQNLHLQTTVSQTCQSQIFKQQILLFHHKLFSELHPVHILYI